MSRPRIIWLGNSTQQPVPRLLDQLRVVGEVHIQRELRQLCEIAQVVTTQPADFCMIHWEYAGQWSVAQLNELAQSWPLTSYVVVVGEWATSATRHGVLWPQAEQFACHDFGVYLALGADRFLTDLRSQQPLPTERWDDRTLRTVQSTIPVLQCGPVHCICDSNESIRFWQEFFQSTSPVIRIDYVQSAAELSTCQLDPAADILLIESDLSLNTIQSWLQTQSTQARQIIIISSFLQAVNHSDFQSIEHYWTLCKPVNLRLVTSTLAKK